MFQMRSSWTLGEVRLAVYRTVTRLIELDMDRECPNHSPTRCVVVLILLIVDSMLIPLIVRASTGLVHTPTKHLSLIASSRLETILLATILLTVMTIPAILLLLETLVTMITLRLPAETTDDPLRPLETIATILLDPLGNWMTTAHEEALLPRHLLAMSLALDTIPLKTNQFLLRVIRLVFSVPLPLVNTMIDTTDGLLIPQVIGMATHPRLHLVDDLAHRRRRVWRLEVVKSMSAQLQGKTSIWRKNVSRR